MAKKNIKSSINSIVFVLIFFLSGVTFATSPETLTFKMTGTPLFTMGDKDLMFGSIDWICEDINENLYILDSKTFKVFKISKEGKLLISWGNQGQGPGDWIEAHSLHWLPDGNLAVNDENNYVSIFNPAGKFLKRIYVPGNCVNLSILAEDLFFGCQWTKNTKEQVLIDKNGKTIKRFFSVSKDMFSVNTPDETGRLVMSSHFSAQYSPHLVFTNLGNYSAIGVSNKYEIFIVKSDGSLVSKISRNIPADVISKDERIFLEKEVLENRNLPQNTKKAFIKKIPEFKNYYDSIILSSKYVWVCRVRTDAADDKSPYNVDLFDYQGNFKGSFQLEDKFLCVGNKFLYCVMSDNDDNLLVSKYGYTLK